MSNEKQPRPGNETRKEAEMKQDDPHREATNNPNDSVQRRQYNYSSLPVLGNLLQPSLEEQKLRQELYLGLYKELCTSWRSLVDVRFKLLGLVPAASIAVIVALLFSDTSKLNLPPLFLAVIQTGVALFGLTVTYALFVYDQRNSQLHDDLISRGRRIEQELSVHTGHFMGRLESYKWFFRKEPPKSFKLGILHIKHDTATNLIYGAAMIAWLLTIGTIWLRWFF